VLANCPLSQIYLVTYNGNGRFSSCFFWLSVKRVQPSILQNLFVVSLALLVASCGPMPEKPAAPSNPAPQSILTWASDPLLVEKFYSKEGRIVANVGPDGAISVNREWQEGKRPEFYIEQQRYGVDLVIAGLVTGNQTLLEQGYRVIDWGFARQGPDGDFPGTGDPMHSTSFMVESAARAALALQESGDPAHQQKAAEWTPKILAAARWMASPAEIDKDREKVLDPFTHRFYLRGAALAEAAKLGKDKALEEAARRHLSEGLSRQTKAGVNPERGGFDVSYQAVGIYYAQFAWLALEDQTMRRALELMMARAFEPILARVSADGVVSVEDSTRALETGRSGAPKRVAYRAIIPALLNYAKISGDPRYSEFAQKIASQAWK
jgi:hypothetical protein